MSTFDSSGDSASRIFVGDIDDTRLALSGYLFGSNVSYMLLAFIIAQTYTYRRYSGLRKDNRYIQIGVYGLVLFQALQTVADSFGAYRTFVFVWGDPDDNYDLPASIVDGLTRVSCSVTGIFVQCFYIMRIWNFSIAMSGPLLKFIIGCMCIFTGTLLLVACGSAIGSAVISIPGTTPLSDAAFRALVSIITVWSISSAVADSIVSISMVIILFHARSNTSFKETWDRFSKTLRAIIQTGFITTALAIFVAISTLSPGRVGDFGGLPPFLIGKSYVISFLSVLNARVPQAAIVRGRSTGPDPTSRAAPRAPTGTHYVHPPATNLDTTASNQGLARRIRLFAKAIINHRGLEAAPPSTDLEFQVRRSSTGIERSD